MKNYVNENLAKLASLMSIPAEVNTYEEYMKMVRIPMNACLVELALGAELGYPADKNEVTVKFDGKRRVNEGELALMKNSLTSFIKGVETPFLNKIGESDNEDGMDIPAVSAANIFSPEKITGKTAADMVSLELISDTLLTAADIDVFYEVGQKLHRKKTIKWSIIIGTVALLLTGGAVALMLRDKDKEEEVVDNGEIDGEIDEPYEESEIPEVDVPESEVPESEIPESGFVA